MAERILVIDDDVDTLRLVGLMLQRQGYQVSAAPNGSQGLAKAFEERPDLILLDVMMPDMDGFEVTRRLRKNPATASIPILMFTAKNQLDDKVTGFEVGADDYLTKPTHPTELQLHVKALLARSASLPKTDEIKIASNEKRGYVIGVLAVRGGLGVSTVAVNLAASLQTRVQEDIILAELTPGQGTISMDLGLPPQKGLSDLLRGTVAEITREKVASCLVSHSSGIKVLASSDNPRDVDLASRDENFEALVNRLSALSRFVILDLGSGLSTSIQKTLAMCNERIVVLEGMANSIQHTRVLLEELTAMKIDMKTVSVILNNRQRTEAQVPWAQVQEKLGHSISTTLTPVPELFLQAQRLHVPVVVAQPNNMIAQQFTKLADATLEREKTQ